VEKDERRGMGKMKRALVMVLVTAFVLMGCGSSVKYNVQPVVGFGSGENEEEVIITSIRELEEFIAKYNLYQGAEDTSHENLQELSYTREFFYKNSIIAIVFPTSSTPKYFIGKVDSDSKGTYIEIEVRKSDQVRDDIVLRGFFIEVERKAVDREGRIKIRFLHK
jgi:hypothetical protein